jgi:hypothetical protein
MNTTAASFFSKEENQAILRRFAVALESVQTIEPPAPNVLVSLKQFFKILIANTNVFDQHCATNIEWIGQRFIGQLTEFSETKLENQSDLLISIFTSAYRFLCELDFSQPDDLSFELRAIRNFVEENLERFVGTERQQLVYANYVMPANITKKLIHSPALAEFKAFAETAKAASDLKQEWEKEINAKSEEIEALRNGLSRITTTYNFVGLVNGFENLASAKKSERLRSFLSLLALGALMVAPVAVQLWFTASHIDTIDTHRNTLVYSLPPLIALEVILLYLFRVVLLHFRGVTTQLLQINLRISLCQFIQSYSEYSTKIKKEDAGALEKFESLIFSGITSDSEALPSTFDGVEQIAKLVNSIRSGK